MAEPLYTNPMLQQRFMPKSAREKGFDPIHHVRPDGHCNILALLVAAALLACRHHYARGVRLDIRDRD
jgi:hypothetical protein